MQTSQALSKNAVEPRKVWFAPSPCSLDRDPDTKGNKEPLGGRGGEGKENGETLIQAIFKVAALSQPTMAKKPRKELWGQGWRGMEGG